MDIRDFTEECLTEEQRSILKLVGTEAFIKLVEAYGGKLIYIPMPNSILRPSRNIKIRAEFDGGNYYQLAQKYGLSELSIRLIVADKDRDMRQSQVDGQLSMEPAANL